MNSTSSRPRAGTRQRRTLPATSVHDAAALGGLVGERRELRRLGEVARRDAVERGAARWPAGCRRVMVPVLSSRSTSTSPAASTARPDMASTLRRTSRSMPAMPIAESSAPMVVGIRQTSSATSTSDRLGGAGVVGERLAGCTTTTTNTMVSAISRMLRAISLGVRCRSEPSTSAIIRSTNECPGSEVIRTTIRSDSTVVPPVTAAAVAAGLADHRRGLAGDGGLVDATRRPR